MEINIREVIGRYKDCLGKTKFFNPNNKHCKKCTDQKKCNKLVTKGKEEMVERRTRRTRSKTKTKVAEAKAPEKTKVAEAKAPEKTKEAEAKAPEKTKEATAKKPVRRRKAKRPPEKTKASAPKRTGKPTEAKKLKKTTKKSSIADLPRKGGKLSQTPNTNPASRSDAIEHFANCVLNQEKGLRAKKGANGFSIWHPDHTQLVISVGGTPTTLRLASKHFKKSDSGCQADSKGYPTVVIEKAAVKEVTEVSSWVLKRLKII